jgi:hypothetical protein
MRNGIRLNSPALAISLLALFAALGGTVYAAAKIDGRKIAVKSLPGNRLRPRSLPGNRLKPHSLPANRLKPGVLRGIGLSGPLTGADINELTLGQVPSAVHSDSAESSQRAVEAETALNAVNAVDAETVNGHSAGCDVGTSLFAGACWQASPSAATATAPEAAADCAARGGTLPGALQLAAFAKLSGVVLDGGDEWSGEIVTFTADNAYAVATVSSASVVGSALFNGGGSSAKKHYRCVIPLLR